ncbi:MAG: hypothetical protein II800_09130 [Lachnospiraceae bacterium]|nr:hypothetical protein [Lachnospiraceae bacterium]
MFLPLLTSFLIFVAIVQIAIRRGDSREKEETAAFFKREHEANFVRKKDLGDLDYIRIPIDRLPFGAAPDHPEILDAEKTVRSLADQKIVNLTGISNTDLKLRYGTANITPLSAYDANYMELARALNKWGRELYAEGLYEEAGQVLTFAVETRSDVSQTWHLYIECIRFHAGLAPEEISRTLQSRLTIAESLDSLSRDAILAELQAAIEAVSTIAS